MMGDRNSPVPTKVGPTKYQHLWHNIAQDIVLSRLSGGAGTAITPDDICNNYGITREECAALLGMPEFRAIVTDYKKRVAALGDNAQFMLRAQMMAASLMEQVYLAAMNPHAELKEKRQALEKLAQYGGLDPATNGTNKAKGDGTGNASAIGQVIINIPAGIPGMEHLRQPVATVEAGAAENG